MAKVKYKKLDMFVYELAPIDFGFDGLLTFRKAQKKDIHPLFSQLVIYAINYIKEKDDIKTFFRENHKNYTDNFYLVPYIKDSEILYYALTKGDNNGTVYLFSFSELNVDYEKMYLVEIPN